MRTTDETTGELAVTVFKNTNTHFNVELPPYLPKATLNAQSQAVVGAPISVEWTGPNERSDLITVTEIGTRPSKYINYAYAAKGNPAQLAMPTTVGEYELRYWLSEGNKILATRPIIALPADSTLSAPDTAIAGDTILVKWTGPNYRNDHITIANLNSKGVKYKTYNYTKNGSPLQLKMPTDAGDFEIRYIMSQGSTILSSRPITISDAKASLIAPDVAIAGEDIIVEWVGPDYKNDYIDVANPTPVATAQTKWINYTYTKSGSPLRLQMPSEPGDYIIRYVVSQGSTIIAKHPIRVDPVGVSISAPTTAKAGEELLVEWDGPDYKGDYISVSKHDVSGSKYAYYTYTRRGSPLRLKMPLDPGEYELRYILSQDSSIKARQNITVKPISVTLDFENTAKIAEPFLIKWQGPNYKNDYITVAEIGTRPSKYINYTYTQSGSPLRVTMPTKHGEYEIRYIANGSPDKVLAKKPLTVETVTASVNLSGTATAGASALIEWTGPNYKGDYIGISKPDTQKYLSYTYTRNGTPLRLKMPDKPGSYELRYFLNAGNTIIARERITVE